MLLVSDVLIKLLEWSVLLVIASQGQGVESDLWCVDQLVLNQGDQRHYYNGYSRLNRGGKLEKKAFSSTGRHATEDIVAAFAGIDYCLLALSEAWMAKHPLIVIKELFVPLELLIFPKVHVCLYIVDLGFGFIIKVMRACLIFFGLVALTRYRLQSNLANFWILVIWVLINKRTWLLKFWSFVKLILFRLIILRLILLFI